MSDTPSIPDRPDDRPREPQILEPVILDGEHSPAGPFSAGWASTGAHPPNYVRSDKPFPWGCILGGCLSVVGLMVVGVVAIGLGSAWFYNQQLAKYTSEEARPLPVVEVSQEELEELELRVETFQEKVDQGETPEQLVLTADQVNVLISQEEKLRGKVFVTIKDDLIQAEVSIPASALPGGQGRFFNGSVSVDASLEDGVLIVTLQDAEVNGEPVPEQFMREIRKENLAKDMYKNPEMAKKLRKFESLVIEGDRIILTPKHPPEPGKPQEQNLPEVDEPAELGNVSETDVSETESIQ